MIIYFLIMLLGAALAARLFWEEIQKDKKKSYLRTPAFDLSPRLESSTISKKNPDFDLISRNFKLEQLLSEKNDLLRKIEQELEIERKHRFQFEGIQNLLEAQLQESRSAIRELKNDLEKNSLIQQKYSEQVLRLQKELSTKNAIIKESENRLWLLQNQMHEELSKKISDISNSTLINIPDPQNQSVPIDFLDWRNQQLSK